MPEQQNIEYKSAWHDDYLKWVCGFANAQGGIIFIGKDDNGRSLGILEFKRLMDDIPNKIRNSMGITVEVNLHEENGKFFIEIIIYPYSVPISLRGRYYYRSGSTKQELTGAALNEFLLKKSGKTWDDVIESRADFTDIDENVFNSFIAISREYGRLPETVGLTIPEIMEKLRLVENGQPKRAAIVLFGKDPGKFYPNMFVKIGRFENDDTNLRFQEVEEGNLILLLRSVLDQLNHKFLIRQIDFEGMHRIERGEYPVAAIREMLLNALVHRNYMGAPIQMRISDNKISIWNEGALPEGLSLEALKRPHSSKPRNPIVADVCFKGGLIDSWGRGTIRILETCKQAQLPEPELIEIDGGFMVTLFSTYHVLNQEPESGLNERQVDILSNLSENQGITSVEYSVRYGITDRTARRDLTELVEKQLLLKTGVKKSTKYYVR
ncbi:ATP-binding protein [Gynurincola endophyticus]|uniref:ATP-binding protein n=1 Tax=Gynurincola endophyticus TaxID=2479004 RepID=UPI000F8C775D|nr:ATP-binding protein [Gynurincola endophyticus]